MNHVGTKIDQNRWVRVYKSGSNSISADHKVISENQISQNDENLFIS